MDFKLIAGPFRIDSGASGAPATIQLRARPGGRFVKGANYQIKVVAAGADAQLRISLELYHGPDGATFLLHSTPIAYSDPGGTFPMILNGDSDPTKMLGEFLQGRVLIKANSGTTVQWAMIEVYEMRKPF